jgi:nicotinamidase-related amidase
MTASDPAPGTEHPRIESSLLLLVDVQGRLARLMHESEAMIRQQAILIRACRLLEVPVLWAEQLPDKLGPTVDELQQPLAGLVPSAKSSFGCCGDAALRQALESSGRAQILLCGIEAHVCVWQTAAALLGMGRSVYLVADAVSSRSVFNRNIALRRMERAGVHLSNVEMLLFELMQDASHPRFRDVTALLK